MLICMGVDVVKSIHPASAVGFATKAVINKITAAGVLRNIPRLLGSAVECKGL